MRTLRSQKVMDELRCCKACSTGYCYTDTHTNPRYCPTCISQCTRKCRTCRTPFHPERDTDRLCAICFVHPALF